MLHIIDILLEAVPDSLEVMRQRVQALADREDPKIDDASAFLRLKAIPGLHFMSMQIFEDEHFDPLFVFENNFDGDPDDYWDGVLKQLSEDLRGIFACTKRAKMERWQKLFQDGSHESLKPFLMAYACSPSAQHFGAASNTLANIQRDRVVFEEYRMNSGL